MMRSKTSNADFARHTHKKWRTSTPVSCYSSAQLSSTQHISNLPSLNSTLKLQFFVAVPFLIHTRIFNVKLGFSTITSNFLISFWNSPEKFSAICVSKCIYIYEGRYPQQTKIRRHASQSAWKVLMDEDVDLMFEHKKRAVLIQTTVLKPRPRWKSMLISSCV